MRYAVVSHSLQHSMSEVVQHRVGLESQQVSHQLYRFCTTMDSAIPQVGSANGNQGNSNDYSSGQLIVDQLQRGFQSLRAELLQSLSDRGASSAPPARVSNQGVFRESPGARPSSRELGSRSVWSRNHGAFEMLHEVEVSPDFPETTIPKQTPPSFDGRGENFKHWLKAFKRYSLYHDFYPAYANKLDLDMTDPYSAYQVALDTNIDVEMFQRAVVADWALSEACHDPSYVNIINQERVPWRAWERLIDTYMPASVASHASLKQSLVMEIWY